MTRLWRIAKSGPVLRGLLLCCLQPATAHGGETRVLDVSLTLDRDEVLRYKLEVEYEFMLPSPEVTVSSRYEAVVDVRELSASEGPERDFELRVSKIEVTRAVNQELEDGKHPWIVNRMQEMEGLEGLGADLVTSSRGALRSVSPKTAVGAELVREITDIAHALSPGLPEQPTRIGSQWKKEITTVPTYRTAGQAVKAEGFEEWKAEKVEPNHEIEAAKLSAYLEWNTSATGEKFGVKEDIEAWVAVGGGFVVESKGSLHAKGSAPTFVGGGAPHLSAIESGSYGFYYKCLLLERMGSAGKNLK